MTFCARLMRGRGPAQKVTFFEVFQAGKALFVPGSCGEEARHKKSPFLRCFRPERPKKGDVAGSWGDAGLLRGSL